MIKLILIPVMLMAVSCTSYVQQRYDYIEEICDKYKGDSIEKIIINWGQPTSITHVGEITIYHYHFAYGTQVDYHAYNNFGGISSRETFDNIQLMVKNGIIINSKINVQR